MGEEAELYRQCQQEVRETISLCRQLGKVRVITSLRGGADVHEPYAERLHDDLFQRWTGLDASQDCLRIMPGKGSQRKFQEKEFSGLVKDGLRQLSHGSADRCHFVSIGSDINYRNATFVCAPRAERTVYQALQMRDHQYDLGFRDLGFFRDRSVVSCASIIEQHQILRRHIRFIVSDAAPFRAAEDYHFDDRKGIALYFQRDLAKLEAYLKKFGKRKTQDVPFVSYGKNSIDFNLTAEDEITVIDMDYIASKLDEYMQKRDTSMDGQSSASSVARPLVQTSSIDQTDTPLAKRSVTQMQSCQQGSPAPVAQGRSLSDAADRCEPSEPVDMEEQRRQMREARLKAFCT